MAELKPFWRNFIDGAWVDGGAGRLAVADPATGETVAEQALADEADVDRAVAAARSCHESGALCALRPVERGRMVRGMGEYLLSRIDEIAPAMTLEAGKPLWESRIEVEGAARYFEYYGNQAETVEGRSIPLGSGYYDFTAYEPYGVSAQVIPWNYPLEMTARSLSAALATGNAAPRRPSWTPNGYIAEAAEAVGLPPGAVNILCGIGSEAGAALTAHPGVNQIVFTGSVETGIAIATAAARNVVPSVLELGGKSAAIVCEDADLDALIDNVRWGIFFNAGQVCSAMSRLIVPEGLRDEVLGRTEALAKSLSVGPGIERPAFGPNMGAMISDAQRDRAEALCRRAEAAGARAVAGGRKLNRPGSFLEADNPRRRDPGDGDRPHRGVRPGAFCDEL